MIVSDIKYISNANFFYAIIPTFFFLFVTSIKYSSITLDEDTKVTIFPNFISFQVGQVLVCWTSTLVGISWCVWYKKKKKKTLINCICHSQGQKTRKKQPIAWSHQQCPALYVITMFIGFLFSQWQKGHLPTAALSCETYWRTNQSSLTPPIKLQLTILYPNPALQPLCLFLPFLCNIFFLKYKGKIIPFYLTTSIFF